MRKKMLHCNLMLGTKSALLLAAALLGFSCNYNPGYSADQTYQIPGDSVGLDSVALSEEKDPMEEVVGKYEFSFAGQSDVTFQLVMNSDGTCTVVSSQFKDMNIEGVDATGYGSYNYNSSDQCYDITFSSNPPYYMAGAYNIQNCYYPVLDLQGGFIYNNRTAFDAKDPGKRQAIKKIE